jgi:hypothetical protein
MNVDERTVQVVRALVPLYQDDVTVLAGTRGIVVGYAKSDSEGYPDPGALDVAWEGYVFSGDGRLDTFHGFRVNALCDRDVEVIETGRLLDVTVTPELRAEARQIAQGME